MVQIVREVAPVGRKLRSPNHPFSLKTIPYAIQPFLIAPVLPGETLKNLLLQSRVVSDPLKNPLIGWWKEYYFFYVKHTDLDDRELWKSMMLNTATDVSSARTGTAQPRNMQAASAGNPVIDWVQKCLKRVTEEYFRDEGHAWNAGMIDGLPSAYVHGKEESWLDSFTEDSQMPEIDPNDTSAQELDPQYKTWEYMRAMKMVNMSYEDWLKTYGVTGVQVEEPNRPELVRYIKEWTYPTNTVNPADGKPSSAAVWSIQERADKDRFFSHPGFIFGVTVTRPKVYLGNISTSLTGFMDNAMAWMPALMRDEPYTSLKMFPYSKGPVPNFGGDYWIDLRDLFLYGEQYTNYPLSDALMADVNKVANPGNAGNIRFTDQTSIANMFAVAANTYIREDGIVRLNILGAQEDYT